MSDRHLDGMVLAAIATGDRDGSAASAAMSEATAERFLTRLRAIDALDRNQRRAEVKRCTSQLRALDPRSEPKKRVASLLAATMPDAVARRWVAGAPLPRAGFATDPALRASLRRLVQPRAADSEREEREAVLPGERRAALEPWARRIAPGDAAELPRVIGALWLGSNGELEGDARSTVWRRIGRELAEAFGWLA